MLQRLGSCQGLIRGLRNARVEICSAGRLLIVAVAVQGGRKEEEGEGRICFASVISAAQEAAYL